MHPQPPQPGQPSQPPAGPPGYPTPGGPAAQPGTITVRRSVAVIVSTLVLGAVAFVSCGVGAAVMATDPQAGAQPGQSAKPRPRVTVTKTITVTAKPAAPSTPSTPKPSEPATVAVPNVVGKNGAIARDTLERAGFSNIEYASADPDDTVVLLPVNWRVTKQEPAASKKVDPKDLVVLTLVKIS
ncbi:PASTA domain-containing protein [Thermomonospora cellulosilytica]|uniref:PASTA domain-containing protein n=1 Tax=Thermomonospora cellulosilytica TaxID=1411118 RepID=A0A7W3N1M1_9ACTN|nr:PASTA domain-containing protein [Thermomonospora cellulosilytica]MBA9005870.1 hypothetical protein [Thermomonospora cellulosilytica]